MFEQMVSDLRNEKLPESTLLRKRFEAALIKKLGVIQTPYSFWPADTKINPPSKQLLWAAILLHDIENFRMVEAIISSELEEQQKAKGVHDNMHVISTKVQQLINDYGREFVELAPSETFKKNLKHKLEELIPAH